MHGDLDLEMRLMARGDDYPDRASIRIVDGIDDHTTVIDAAALVAWILSPEGRAALARRGVDVTAMIEAATAEGIKC